MKSSNSLGIWLDHAKANLIEFTTNPMETKTIELPLSNEGKDATLPKSESLIHHKEQQDQKEYYHQLAQVIKNYTDVILFGPTDAKVELYNILKANHSFDDIHLSVINADKMTENQQHAFVRKHFSTNN
jgi:stalled ribosome rescue protein Dom34